MGKLGFGVMVVVWGLGGVACLVPSFEGMKESDPAGPTARDTASADAGAATTSSNSGSTTGDETNGSSGGDGKPAKDAGVDAGPRTFLCRASDNMRCKLATEDCCFNVPSTWSCVPRGTLGCTGTTRCGENADCAAGETCCFDGISTGRCATSCSGALAYRACDRSKPGTTCDNGKSCKPPGGSGTVPDHCE